MTARYHCSTANPDYEVEFREPLASMIPLLLKLHKDMDNDRKVRSGIARLISKLTNRGEW